MSEYNGLENNEEKQVTLVGYKGLSLFWKWVPLQAARPVMWPPQCQYAPPPASGDLNSHPELSVWRSMRV